MAQKKQTEQLDFLGHLTHERTPDLRTNGGNTLAGTSPADGGGTGGGKPPAGGAAGRAGTDDGGHGAADPAFHAPGTDAAAGARPGLGTGAGEIHPATPIGVRNV